MEGKLYWTSSVVNNAVKCGISNESRCPSVVEIHASLWHELDRTGHPSPSRGIHHSEILQGRCCNFLSGLSSVHRETDWSCVYDYVYVQHNYWRHQVSWPMNVIIIQFVWRRLTPWSWGTICDIGLKKLNTENCKCIAGFSYYNYHILIKHSSLCCGK